MNDIRNTIEKVLMKEEQLGDLLNILGDFLVNEGMQNKEFDILKARCFIKRLPMFYSLFDIIVDISSARIAELTAVVDELYIPAEPSDAEEVAVA